MLRLSHIFALILSLGIAQCGHAANLQPYEAVYKSELGGSRVKLNQRMLLQDDRVIISVAVRKFWFSMHESSVLAFHEDGILYPITHVHQRRGTSHVHDKDLVFDWTDNTVIELLKPERDPLPVASPCYDKLSYRTQMRLDLLRDPDLQHIEYCVTNGFRNRIYSFARLSEEELTTPLGQLNTIKFERTGDDDERQVFVWVAPDWNYLLVRFDQTKKPGAKTEHLVLERATIAGKKVKGLSP